jgi:hypothetical protein
MVRGSQVFSCLARGITILSTWMIAFLLESNKEIGPKLALWTTLKNMEAPDSVNEKCEVVQF